MTSAALDLLDRVHPAWFEDVRRTATDLCGTVRMGPWARAGLVLTIRDGSSLRVAETAPGETFPVFCPERHIQGRGEFCLGLGKTVPKTTAHARSWWGRLEQFLRCQASAERTGVWPLGHGLDHDGAGEYHRRALRLAERLKVDEAYLEAYLGQPSWFTGAGLSKLGERGAKRASGPSQRAPLVFGGRRARLALLELVMLERARRKALNRFWADMRVAKVKCCGTMRDCPLARSEGTAEPVRRRAA